MAQIKFIPGKRRKPRQLSELLQTLPQELFDKIYDLTFTAEPGLRDLGYVTSADQGTTFRRQYRGQQFLGADSKALLQVDRASRAKYASSYYGEGSIFLAHSPYAAGTWLKSIDPRHECLIADLPPNLSYGLWMDGRDKILETSIDEESWVEIIKELSELGFGAVPTFQECEDICRRSKNARKGGTPMRWSGGAA